MAKKAKTTKRTEFIDAVYNCMKQHEYFSDRYTRDDNEGQIQKVVFSRLHSQLPEIYEKYLGINKEKAVKIIDKTFAYEKNQDLTMHNRLYFGLYHRPDAEIFMDKNLKLAIEIKKGNQGSDIRSGLGQSLVYSQIYDFVLYVFVDTSDERKIRNNSTADDEKALIESIWEHYNIRFKVV